MPTDGLITNGQGVWARKESVASFLPNRLYVDSDFGLVVSRWRCDHSFEVHNGKWVGDYVDGELTVREYPDTKRPTAFHEVVGMTREASRRFYVHDVDVPLLEDGQEGYGQTERGRRLAAMKPLGDEVIGLVDNMDQETVKSLLYHLADQGKVSGLVAAAINKMGKNGGHGDYFDDDIPF